MPDDPHEPPSAAAASPGDTGDTGPAPQGGGRPKPSVGRGTAWTIGGYAASNMIRLAGNLVLARLLFPEAFGIMALIQSVMQGLFLFTDTGVSPCIVQHERGDEPRFLNTAFAIQNMRGVFLTLATAALAYPMVLFYQSTDPQAQQLLWFLPAAGASAFIDGLVSTRLYSAKRHYRWDQITKLELMSQVTALVVMVSWASLHASVWALVVGLLVSSATRTLLSHLYLDGVRNWPGWDPVAARQLFHFGKWIFISTLLTFLAGRTDRLIMGKVVDLALLGVFGIAATLAALPTGALVKLGGSVFFPVFSRLRDQPEKLVETLDGIRRPLLLCSGAMIAGMIAGGPALIDLLYDDRYLQAGWILQILVIGAWFSVLESPNTAILLAMGRTGWLAAGNGAKLIGLVVFLPLGYHVGGRYDQPFTGILVGLALTQVTKYVFSTAVVRTFGIKVFLPDILLGLAVACTAALGIGAGHLLAPYQPHPAVLLVATSGVSAGFWVPPAYVWMLRYWRKRHAA